MKPSLPTRLLAGILSVVIFLTNAALAHAAESNFWADRRKSVQRKADGDKAVQVAALPAASAELLRQLPAMERLSPALSQRAAEDLPPEFVRTHAGLLGSLTQAFGTIRRIDLPAGKSTGRVVVHIQDVHMNAEAQRNIGGAVQALIDGKAGLVALEGAFAPVDLSRFRAFPDRDAVRRAADYLLGENKISGPVHAAFTGAGDLPPFVGVDDAAHYRANVQAYQTSAPKVDGYKAKLGGLKAGLERRKESVFNPALRDFDRRVGEYREGKSSLGDHVRVLAKEAPGRLPPQVRDFVEALDMETALDFKRVESERSRLIGTLIPKLNRAQVDGLMRRSVAYRLGQVRYADYYRELRDLCEASGAPLSGFPAMDAYVRYVLLADRIAAEELLEEIGGLEKACYARLAKTEAEKALVRESDRLHLTGKLIDFSLTPEEWKEYVALARHPGEGRGPGFETVAGAKLSSLDSGFRRNDAFEKIDFSSFESFYREAHARDQAMADNLLAAMAAKGAGAAVLVTGGYHGPGVMERLKRAGVAVVSFVPRIEKADALQGSAYLSVFTREKSPLQSLFAGRTLFLSPVVTENLPEAALAVVGTKLISDADKEALSSRAKEFFGRLAIGSVDDVDVHAELKSPGEALLRVRFLKGGHEVKAVELDLTMEGGKITAINQRSVGDWRDDIISAEELAALLVQIEKRGAPAAEYGLFADVGRRDENFKGDRLSLLALHVNRTVMDIAMRTVGIEGIARSELNPAGLGVETVREANIAAHRIAIEVFPGAPLTAGGPKSWWWADRAVPSEEDLGRRFPPDFKGGEMSSIWLRDSVSGKVRVARGTVLEVNSYEERRGTITARLRAPSGLRTVKIPFAPLKGSVPLSKAWLPASVDSFTVEWDQDPLDMTHSGHEPITITVERFDPSPNTLTGLPWLEQVARYKRRWLKGSPADARSLFLPLIFSLYRRSWPEWPKGSSKFAAPQDGPPGEEGRRIVVEALKELWADPAMKMDERVGPLPLLLLQAMANPDAASALRGKFDQFLAFGFDDMALVNPLVGTARHLRKGATPFHPFEQFSEDETGFVDAELLLAALPRFIAGFIEKDKETWENPQERDRSLWTIATAFDALTDVDAAAEKLGGNTSYTERLYAELDRMDPPAVAALFREVGGRDWEAKGPFIHPALAIEEDNASYALFHLAALPGPSRLGGFTFRGLGRPPREQLKSILKGRSPETMVRLFKEKLEAAAQRFEAPSGTGSSALSASPVVKAGPPAKNFDVRAYYGAALAAALAIALTFYFGRDASRWINVVLSVSRVCLVLMGWRWWSVGRMVQDARRQAEGLPELDSDGEKAVRKAVARLMDDAFDRLSAPRQNLSVRISKDMGPWVPARRLAGTDVLEVSDWLAKLILNDKIAMNVLKQVLDHEAGRFLDRSLFRLLLARLQLRPYFNPVQWSLRRVARVARAAFGLAGMLFFPRPARPAGPDGASAPLSILEVTYIDQSGTGGTERYMAELNRRLLATPGLTIHLVSPTDGPTGRFEEKVGNGLLIHHPIPKRHDKFSSFSPRVFRDVKRELSGILRRERVDVIHLHFPQNTMVNLAALWAGLRYRVPHAVTPHLALQWFPMRLRRLVTTIPNVFLLFWTFHLVGVSRAAVRGYGKRPVLMGGGIDTEWFTPRPGEAEAFRAERGVEDGRKVIFYPARLEHNKGQKDLMALARLLRARGVKARILAMGPGHDPAYAASIRADIDAEGLADYFQILPPGSPQDVRAGLSAADVMVFPSYTEALPLIALEAASMEVPVVAYASGGMPEAVRDGRTGYLVQTGDAESLAAKTVYLLENEDRRRAIGKTARSFVTRAYSLDRLVEKHLRLYRRLAGIPKEPAEVEAPAALGLMAGSPAEEGYAAVKGEGLRARVQRLKWGALRAPWWETRRVFGGMFWGVVSALFEVFKGGGPVRGPKRSAAWQQAPGPVKAVARFWLALLNVADDVTEAFSRAHLDGGMYVGARRERFALKDLNEKDQENLKGQANVMAEKFARPLMSSVLMAMASPVWAAAFIWNGGALFQALRPLGPVAGLIASTVVVLLPLVLSGLIFLFIFLRHGAHNAGAILSDLRPFRRYRDRALGMAAGERLSLDELEPAGELGDGTTGRVFIGRTKDGERVAVKITDKAGDAFVERFSAREPRLMEALEGIPTRARIPRVRGTGILSGEQALRWGLGKEWAGNDYLIMDLLSGETLAKRVDLLAKGTPQDTRNREPLLALLLEAAETLEDLHARRIFHGDVGFDQLLVDGETGRMGLVDFMTASAPGMEAPPELLKNFGKFNLRWGYFYEADRTWTSSLELRDLAYYLMSFRLLQSAMKRGLGVNSPGVGREAYDWFQEEIQKVKSPVSQLAADKMPTWEKVVGKLREFHAKARLEASETAAALQSAPGLEGRPVQASPLKAQFQGRLAEMLGSPVMAGILAAHPTYRNVFSFMSENAPEGLMRAALEMDAYSPELLAEMEQGLLKEFYGTNGSFARADGLEPARSFLALAGYPDTARYGLAELLARKLSAFQLALSTLKDLGGELTAGTRAEVRARMSAVFESIILVARVLEVDSKMMEEKAAAIQASADGRAALGSAEDGRVNGSSAKMNGAAGPGEPGLQVVEDEGEMARAAAELIRDRINAWRVDGRPDKKKRFVLGLSTGSTPVGVYRLLKEMVAAKELSFRGVVTFNLDEHIGLKRDHAQTYRSFMFKNFVDGLDIDPNDVHVLNGTHGTQAALEEECRDYEALIAEYGGIDLQLLGIGSDGHIAFNEPIVEVDGSFIEALERGDPRALARIQDFNDFSLDPSLEDRYEDVVRLIAERRARQRTAENLEAFFLGKRPDLGGKPRLLADLIRQVREQGMTVYLDGPADGLGARLGDARVRIADRRKIADSVTRIVDVALSTLADNSRLFGDDEQMPVRALTMGVGTIKRAKERVLISFKYSEAVAKALEGPSPLVSASYVADRTRFIITRDAAAKIPGVAGKSAQRRSAPPVSNGTGEKTGGLGLISSGWIGWPGRLYGFLGRKGWLPGLRRLLAEKIGPAWETAFITLHAAVESMAELVPPMPTAALAGGGVSFGDAGWDFGRAMQRAEDWFSGEHGSVYVGEDPALKQALEGSAEHRAVKKFSRAFMAPFRPFAPAMAVGTPVGFYFLAKGLMQALMTAFSQAPPSGPSVLLCLALSLLFALPALIPAFQSYRLHAAHNRDALRNNLPLGMMGEPPSRAPLSFGSLPRNFKDWTSEDKAAFMKWVRWFQHDYAHQAMLFQPIRINGFFELKKGGSAASEYKTHFYDFMRLYRELQTELMKLSPQSLTAKDVVWLIRKSRKAMQSLEVLSVFLAGREVADPANKGIAKGLVFLSHYLLWLMGRSMPIAKGNAGEGERSVSVHAVLEDILDFFPQVAEVEKNQVDMPSDPGVHVPLSAMMLTGVLLNLLGNSDQAFPYEAPRDIGVDAWEEGGRPHLLVRDGGAGIPGDILPGIFDPDVSTRGGANHGIGLSIVLDNVMAAGGTIRVVSKKIDGESAAIQVAADGRAVRIPAPGDARIGASGTEFLITFPPESSGPHRGGPSPSPAERRGEEGAVQLSGAERQAEAVVSAAYRIYAGVPGTAEEDAAVVRGMLSGTDLALDVENGFGPGGKKKLESPLDARAFEAALARKFRERFGRLGEDEARWLASQVVLGVFAVEDFDRVLGPALQGKTPFVGSVIDPGKDPVAYIEGVLARTAKAKGEDQRVTAVFLAGRGLSSEQAARVAAAARRFGIQTEVVVDARLFRKIPDTLRRELDWLTAERLFKAKAAAGSYSSVSAVFPKALIGDISRLKTLPAEAFLRGAAIVLVDDFFRSLPVLRLEDLIHLETPAEKVLFASQA